MLTSLLAPSAGLSHAPPQLVWNQMAESDSELLGLKSQGDQIDEGSLSTLQEGENRGFYKANWVHIESN